MCFQARQRYPVHCQRNFLLSIAHVRYHYGLQSIFVRVEWHSKRLWSIVCLYFTRRTIVDVLFLLFVGDSDLTFIRDR